MSKPKEFYSGAALGGLKAWLPEKKWEGKEPENLEDLFAKYAEEDNFFGVNRGAFASAAYESYMQGMAAITTQIAKDLYGKKS